MKKSLFILLIFALFGTLSAQTLPKDVAKVYKSAEKLKSKKQYDRAVEAYKEVLKSVPGHYKSMESIGDIEMKLRARPNYRNAFEYYQKALNALDAGIAGTDKKKVQQYLQNEKKRIVPNFNKAKAETEAFNKAKSNRAKGNRLMDDE